MKNEEFATAVNSFDSSSISMIKETPKNPFLSLMGFIHSYSVRESSNPSELAFAASQTEYSLTA